MNTPPPGIYPDVPADEYHSWDAVSNSRLSTIHKHSPAHLRHELDNPSEPTPAMALGSALHDAVLLPDVYRERYAVAPPCDRRTKAGKATWAAFCESSAGCTLLTDAQSEAVDGMSASVRSHPRVAELLAHPTARTELSIVWIDPGTGLTCKARLDILADCGEWIAGDLKTTSDAKPAEFSRSVWNFGYHRQAAMYTDALAAHGIDCPHFLFVAVESSPPYAVSVHRMLDEAVQAGRDQIQPLLETYRVCMESGVWPAWGDDVHDLGLPYYAQRQLEMTA